jgi:excinuclease UvrABC nuclease subunit
MNDKVKMEDIQGYRNEQGIYVLTEKDSIVYIGYSSNVYTRILEHLVEDKKAFNKVHFFEIEHKDDPIKTNYLIIEMFLISKKIPKYNKLFFKNIKQWYWSLPCEKKDFEFYDMESNEVIESMKGNGYV